MRLRLTTALTVAAVVFAVTACTASAVPSTGPTTGVPAGATGAGGSQPAGGGGGGAANVTDPCALLTQADVSAALGKQFGPGSSADNPDSCVFQYPAEGQSQIDAGINFAQGSLADICNDPGASALGLSIETVSGIGDGACFVHVGKLRAGSSLTFAKGGRLFQTFALLPAGATPDDTKAADTALAKAAVAHL
jgi:hypothetical protein